MTDDRNMLWNKIASQCIPHYMHDGTYGPCALVDINRGFVVYKVDGDKYQYLLLPTDRITGIEDVSLLITQHNYIYEAWQSRAFLLAKIGKNLSERDIVIAVNAKNARTQDQLHLHISCISGATRSAFDSGVFSGATSSWSTTAIKINSRPYFYRKISEEELKKGNFFKLIKDKVDLINGNIAWTGAALINLDSGNFVILLAVGSIFRGGAGEELQDHECGVVR